ncbi:MAG TPA: SCO family protein [Pseudomonadales bacterium]
MLTASNLAGSACRALVLLLALGLAGVPVAEAEAPSGHDHPAPEVLAPGYSKLEFEPPVPGTYRLPPLGDAGDGAVLDSGGRPRALHDYLGDKLVVLSFIYTRCSDVNGCPLATFVLKGVQDRVLAARDLEGKVRLVSFSFDPGHDTPEVLEKYASYFRRPGFDWQFLTTRSEAELAPILDGYGQYVVRDEGNGLQPGTVSHLLRVYLIDREKRIRNIYSTSFLHADTVVNDLRTVLLEAEDAR